jgi:hypothetical protein
MFQGGRKWRYEGNKEVHEGANDGKKDKLKK